MLKELLSENPLILAEGAVIERIKREFNYNLNPFIQNAAMVYNTDGRIILDNIFNQYISVAEKFKLPMLNLAPTWRANQESIESARYKERNVNDERCKSYAVNTMDRRYAYLSFGRRCSHLCR